MISKAENTATIAANAALIQKVVDYKALLTAQELPFSIDMAVLTTTIRTQLFQKLLSVDKGLKMRWDMLKTDEARLKLITDTIDLNGYEIVEQLDSAVKGLESAYNRIYMPSLGMLYKFMPFAQLAETYELDLQAMLDKRTYDWTGREHALAYFNELAPKLTELRDIFRAGVSTSFTLHDTVSVLSRYYTQDSVEGTVEASEGAVMRLVNDLAKAGKSELIPKR